MKLLWGVSLSPKLSSQQTPIWSIPSKSSRQIVVHLGAPLSHQHWKVKFTKDPCTSKKPDPGTLPWYKSYSLYAVCSILEFEKGHLKKISYAPFQLFPKKIWQKRFFLVVGGKDIYIYIYIQKTSQWSNRPTAFLWGKPRPQPFLAFETWLTASDAREGGVTPRVGRGAGMEGRARERRRVGALLNAPGNLKGRMLGGCQPQMPW